MDTLPMELVTQIISYVDYRDLKSMRLVCKAFESTAFPRLFANIPSWLDLEYARYKLALISCDLCSRPTVMWSTAATGPEGPCDPMFLAIIYRLFLGKTMPEETTPDQFAEKAGLKGVDSKTLRMTQNRYLLHRAYLSNRDASRFMMGGMF